MSSLSFRFVNSVLVLTSDAAKPESLEMVLLLTVGVKLDERTGAGDAALMDFDELTD